MSEPSAHIAARCHHHTSYCSRCDLLVGLDGLHVTVVEFDREVGLLTIRVESARAPMGCTSCGVVAHSHGRSDVTLVDAPCFDRPVRLIWRKRDLALPGTIVSDKGVHRARRAGGSAAGLADRPGMLVGDQPDPRRTR